MLGSVVLAALLCFGAGEDDLAETISSNGISLLAVWPQVVLEGEDPADEFAGSLGPLGEDLVRRLHDRLLTSRGGRYRVVSRDDMLQSMSASTLSNPLTPATLDQIRHETDAELLVVLFAQPADNGLLKLTERAVRLTDGNEVYSRVESYERGLSDAAYEGRCFEVLRWMGDELVAVGLGDNMQGQYAYTWGLGAEILKLASLRSDIPHPLADVAGLPYGIMIKANDELREPHRIGGKWYVELNPGEEFQIGIWNDTARPISLGLYVDGVNTIGPEFEHPYETAPNRRWHVALPESWVRAWLHNPSPANPVQKRTPFRVVPRERSVAQEQGARNRYGMITAIFYTDGDSLARLSVPKRPIESRGRQGLYAVGEGDSYEGVVEFATPAKRGLMLAAVTLDYRTADELEQLRRQILQNQNQRSEAVPFPLEIPHGGRRTRLGGGPDQVVSASGEGAALASRNASPTQNRARESEPFPNR